MNKKKRQFGWKGVIIGVAIALFGTIALVGATDLLNINVIFDLGDRLFTVLDEKPVGSICEPALGGTTSDDWNVGGNLAITGTATFSSPITPDAIRHGGGKTDFGYIGDGGQNATATAAQMCNTALWTITPSKALTVGLPDATSTIADCITSIGSCSKVQVRNNSTTSGADISLIAIDNRYGGGTNGRSMLFVASSTPAAGVALLEHGEAAWLEWCNDDGATTTVTFIPFIRDTTN